jgi:outer membrane biosynthesis protein TonB
VKASASVSMLAVALLAIGGCAKRHPRTATVIEPPQPLSVPAPPPRVILPPQPQEPQEPTEEEPQPTSPARPRPRNQGKPTTDTKTEPPKTEAPQTPAPQTEPPAPEKPSQDLQPADAAGEAAIRQQIDRARQNLKRVNYPGLSQDMKAQYQQADRFLILSEQNLREHNLLFASTLAEKAGQIADVLNRR